MNAVGFLLEDLKWSHELLEMVMQDVTHEQAHWTPPGLANPLGATYAHAVCSEDVILHAILLGGSPLFAAQWKGDTGISAPQLGAEFQWARDLEVDLPQARRYAEAVYQATEAYIRSLEEADLDREIDLTESGFGVRKVAWILSALIIAHQNNMAGEISCLKGLQGLKGYPF
jgi:hypothetical protein